VVRTVTRDYMLRRFQLDKPASYIITKDPDGTVNAIDGRTGALKFSDSDAATVIQAAIDSLGSRGGKILIKRGDYQISTGLELAKAETTYHGTTIYQPIAIEGESMLSTKLIADADITMVSATGASGKSFRDLCIRNLWIEGNDKASFGIKISHAAHTRLESLWVSHCKDAGIFLDNTVQTTLLHVITNQNGASGSYRAGLFCNNGTTLHALSCYFWNEGYTGASVGNNPESRFYACIFDSAGDMGLKITGAGVRNTTVHGCFFEDNANYAIYVSGHYAGFSLEDSWFYHNRTAGGEWEIYIADAIAPRIIGNYIEPTGTTQHIYIGSSVVDALIAENYKIGTTAFISDNGTNTTYRKNYGFTTENGGTATFSGDGTTTTFTIPHGLASTPTKYYVTPASADARGDFHVTADGTNLTVTYSTAPPSGTDNVVLVWYAEV